MKPANLHYYYDAEADILYFSQGRPSPRSISRELKNDVIARLDPKTGKAVGFTVLNFRQRTRQGASSIKLPFKMELRPN